LTPRLCNPQAIASALSRLDWIENLEMARHGSLQNVHAALRA
jgi:hypothetical protein